MSLRTIIDITSSWLVNFFLYYIHYWNRKGEEREASG